jgi:phosphoribosylanthranilate isomerase
VQRTRVKICGIGHVEDALAAARAGVDAIGMLFHPPAPRNITPQRAAEILAALPPFVTPVALFVDLPVGRVIDAARSLNIRHIQLHGSETPEHVASLREYTVVKALRVDPATFAGELDLWREAIPRLHLTNLQGFVLETAGTTGGTGRANNWDLVQHHRQRGDFIGLPHLIAAGGLTPENVADVIRTLRPWSVDVSSGVETSPGKKSPEKIDAFLRAVDEAST